MHRGVIGITMLGDVIEKNSATSSVGDVMYAIELRAAGSCVFVMRCFRDNLPA